MLSYRTATLLAAGLALLAGCAPSVKAPPDTSADEAAIRAHAAAWVEAYNAGDSEKVVAGYADDAILMPPDAPAAVGLAAMKQFLVSDMAASKAAGLSFALDQDTVGVAGDFAWHSGTFHVNGPAGSSVGSGKYLEVAHKTNGQWLVTRDMWNMDAAAAPPPPPAAAKKPAPAKHKKKKK